MLYSVIMDINFGIDVLIRDDHGFCPIHYAIEAEDNDIFSDIVKHLQER